MAEYQSKLSTQPRNQLEHVIPLSTPYLIYLDPSSACNFKCQFCPTGHLDLIKNSDYKRGIMSLDLYKKFISDLDDFSQPLKVLRLNKIGEPLLNPNIGEFVRLASISGKFDQIDLATNASLLTPQISRVLCDNGITKINISLEGLSDIDYFNNSLVKVDFRQILANIEYLFEYASKIDIATKPHIHIKIPSSILKASSTNSSVDDFLKLFGSICDTLHVENLAEIWPEFNTESRANVGSSLQDRQYSTQEIGEVMVCSVIFYSMCINSDGSVSACCPDWDQKIIVGDLRKQSLADIWNSPDFRTLRVLHLEKRRYLHPTCSSCGHVTSSQVDNIDEFADQILKNLI